MWRVPLYSAVPPATRACGYRGGMQSPRIAAALLGIVFVSTGCRSDGRTLRKPAVEQAPTGITASFSGLAVSSSSVNGSTSSTTAPGPRRAILSNGEIPVYATADLAGMPIRTLKVPNEFSTVTAVPILGENTTRASLQVQLPGAAQGPATGWIASSAAKIDSSPQSLVVDPIRQQLTLYEGEEVRLTAQVGLGSRYPKIAGRTEFALAIIAAPAEGGVLGDFGIAGSSTTNAASAFVVGDTQVVIHGIAAGTAPAAPDGPGMVRMDAETLDQLARILLPATPLHFLAATS